MLIAWDYSGHTSAYSPPIGTLVFTREPVGNAPLVGVQENQHSHNESLR